MPETPTLEQPLARFQRLVERAVQEEHDAEPPSAQAKTKTGSLGYLVRDLDRDFPTTDVIREVFVGAAVKVVQWPIKVTIECNPHNKVGYGVIFSHDSSNPAEGNTNG
jgi:hypothetical protein